MPISLCSGIGSGLFLLREREQSCSPRSLVKRDILSFTGTASTFARRYFHPISGPQGVKPKTSSYIRAPAAKMSDCTDAAPSMRSGATQHKSCPCHDFGSGARSLNFARLKPVSFMPLKSPSLTQICSIQTVLWIIGRML